MAGGRVERVPSFSPTSPATLYRGFNALSVIGFFARVRGLLLDEANALFGAITVHDGRVVLAWAVDYMTWNEGAIPHPSPQAQAAKRREIWIPGVATAVAKSELGLLGFEVKEKRPVATPRTREG
jgi:hypothetical protein